jgi:hypothetical protein
MFKERVISPRKEIKLLKIIQKAEAKLTAARARARG